MQTIYLDISNKGVVPVVYAKQGDVGRKFEVVLTDSGLPYIPASGSAFSVWYSGASGDGNYTDVGDNSAFDINGNKVTVEMIAQMLSNDGDGVLSLVLNNPNGDQIGIWNIPYFCEHVPGSGSEEATEYYTAFSHAVENLPYPDASLSTPGKAADAEAVGNLTINGKKIRDNPNLNNSDVGAAPDGYGLGTVSTASNSTYVSNADDVTSTGWYKIDSSTTNGIGASAILRVEAYASTYAKQTAIRANGGVIRKRYRDNGTWGEWKSAVDDIGAAPLINIGNFTGDIDDVNALPLNSVAWITPNTVNNSYSNYGVMETWGSINAIRNQRITYTNGCICQRLYYNSSWTEPEWINPPMILGNEYRTAEQFNGKAVYTQFVNMGALPNSGASHIPLVNCTVATRPNFAVVDYRYVMKVSNYRSVNPTKLFATTGSDIGWSVVNPGTQWHAYVQTTGSAEGATAVGQIWYTID